MLQDELSALLDIQSQERGSKWACVTADDRITFDQLKVRSSALRHWLAEQGIGPGDRLALSLERGSQCLVTLLALLQAGICFCPIDAQAPLARLHAMLDSYKPMRLVTDESCARLGQALSWSSQPVPCDGPLLTAWCPPSAPSTNLSDSDEAHCAYVIFTSGSTGTPKGVRVGRASLANCLSAFQSYPGLSDQDVFMGLSALTFDISLLECLLPASVGALQVTGPRSLQQSPSAQWDLIAQHAVTKIQATPQSWHLLVQSAPDAEALSGIDAWVGGEALPQGLSRILEQKCRGVWNLYGPTETTIWSSCTPVDSAQRPGDISRPIAHTHFYLRDRDRQILTGPGEGELLIAGAGLSLGYLDDPALTRERFVHILANGVDPILAYRTGDWVRRNGAGQICFLERMDDQIKLRGHRIELGEIERALEQLPGVVHAACIKRTSSEVDAHLIAFVALAPAASTFDESEGRAQLAKTLPAHAMPARIHVIEDMPLTAHGKLDRKLLSLQAAQFPEPRTAPLNSRHLQAKAEHPDALQAILDTWQTVLGAVNRPGADDNFFHLGGTSLGAMHVALRLKALGYACTLADQIASQDALELAKRIGEKSKQAGQTQSSDLVRQLTDSPEVSALRNVESQRLPASYIALRYLLIEQSRPNGTGNTSLEYRLLDLPDWATHDQVSAAINQAMALHPAFGARLELASPQQAFLTLSQDTIYPVQKQALSPAIDRDVQVRQILARPVLLLQGYRAEFFFLSGSGPTQLLMTVHRGIADGASIGLFVRAFHALLRNHPVDKPTLTPAQVSRYLTQRDASPQAIAAAQHWRSVFRPPVVASRIRFDHPLPPTAGHRMHSFCWQWPADKVRRLRARATALGSMEAAVLMSAFVLFMHRQTGMDQVAVAMPVRGRGELEYEGCVGTFAEILGLVVDQVSSLSPSDLVGAVQKAMALSFGFSQSGIARLWYEDKPAQGQTVTSFLTDSDPDDTWVPWSDETPAEYPVHVDWTFQDFTLYVRRSAASIAFRWVYRESTYEKASVLNWIKEFESCAQALIRD